MKTSPDITPSSHPDEVAAGERMLHRRAGVPAEAKLSGAQIRRGRQQHPDSLIASAGQAATRRPSAE